MRKDMEKHLRGALCAAAVLLACAASFSQAVVTAGDFFERVSNAYAAISDYEADINVTIGDDAMAGHLSFKRPNLLRIDFSDPEDQVVLFNGTDLVIYLPESSAVLTQNVTEAGESSASSPGLTLLRRYYSVSYVSGQSPVPLDEDSDEYVVQLLLSRRSASESFRTMVLSIDPESLLIRRVSATTSADVNYVFDFRNYETNTGIAEQRFIYDPPSSANAYNNFLLAE